ncbi:hypothetical protein JCM10213_005040 [Rhodosporidiobolus nylandii]
MTAQVATAPPAPQHPSNPAATRSGQQPRGRGNGRGRGRGRGRGGAQAAAQSNGGLAGEQDGAGAPEGGRQQGDQKGRGRGRGGRGARGGAGRGGESSALRGRRAQFGAALSSGTSGNLHANASSFTPSPAAAPAVSTPTPAPVNQTLVERLTTELSSGEAECTVCFENITRTARIHSCTECHMPFHLPCIAKWASSSVSTSAERAQLLASRDPRNPPAPETLEGSWSCPNCNAQFSGSKSIPSKYTCFCGRFVDPHPPRGAGGVPHSCNKPCARKRPDGCKHPCSLSCHPGPCPPCPVVLNERCHCGSKPLGIRCSFLHDGKPATPASFAAREALLSCHQPHGAPLGCGLHACERECHAGECGDCEVIREKRCFCGRETAEGICGATRPEERVDGCVRPSSSDGAENERWMGEFSCPRVCGAPYDCGLHSCTSPCHPHTDSSPQRCPRSPELVTSCPCGKTPLSALPNVAPRTKCSDRVPTCGAVCGKVRECGHACRRACHEGECGACQERVPLTCRCGSTTTTRLCSEPYRSLTPPSTSSSSPANAETDIADGGADEFKCARVCKSMRHCGRHQCNRVCCPLSWQEALTHGAKGKGKRRAFASVQDEIAELEAQDPLGVHRCDRTCGRKLNCGIHNCEMRDHKGPCPPCLRADFDELVCNCGSTVVLPPIPCNFVIDCRHPCIRPSECGHPQLPHACHEDPNCPPCPYLMAKKCACGKKTVPNVRCSMDPKKVSCGTVCGKLLRCGWHRCRKPCHPPGECETVDDQMCLKPRKHCSHPCDLACHFPSACSTETPCNKLIEVHCACGHISQKARCGACDAKPEGNNGRLVKCTDACAVAKRNQQLADALGVEKKEPKVREVSHEPQTLSYYAANAKWAQDIETQLTEFVKGDKPSHPFPVMKREQRQFVHEMCEAFELRSEAVDPEPRRSIIAHRTSTCGIPVPTLAEALVAKKTASQTLSLGSLRRTLPERKPNNALYLEGVLGYDEEMLREILSPHMRGLSFSLTWVTDEDVLVSFDAPTPSFELDSKLSSISTSLRHLIGDTGFCVGVESVLLGDDGRVVRGSWTPVPTASTSASASMSATSSGGGSNSASWRPTGIRTANAFASLGTSPPKPAPLPAKNAWASGSIIGAAQNKPPRAVVAPQGEQERFIPPPPASATVPRVPTPSLPPAPPVAKEQQDVPDAWDAED